MTSEETSTRVFADPVDPDGVQSYALDVRFPDQPQRRYEVSQPVLRVGSHAQNDLVVADDAVSRIHFEIAADEHGFRLRDLGSTNGTQVDGYRVVELYLKSGAKIVAGLTRFAFYPLERERSVALSAADRFGAFVGRSPRIRALFAVLERIAPSEATILIEGESGTGKEVVAEAIHESSPRKEGPFVVLDCGAIPVQLMEAELFGYEPGAFTGATERREGALQAAAGGTLFLDEVGELPLEVQPKLLRAVDKKEAMPLGSHRKVPVDVRILAATNRDLAEEVNHGLFREDLYYRLAVVCVRLPPLRKRTEDLPILVGELVRQILGPDARDRADQLTKSITAANWQKLGKHPWRGNVRELRNALERALAMNPDGSFLSVDPTLSGGFGTGPSGPVVHVGGDLAVPVDLERPFSDQRKDLLASFERSYLEQMLSRHGGNFSRAARAAGLDRMYFKRLLKKYR